MTIQDIVRKLLGSIDPVGEHSEDGYRYENIQEYDTLLDFLIFGFILVTS